MIEVLKQALEALEANDKLVNGSGTQGGLAYCMDAYYSDCFDVDPINKQTANAITAIKKALAQPEQEYDNSAVHLAHCYQGEYPVCKYGDENCPAIPKVKAQPESQRTWVGLTDEDWKEIEDMPDTFDQGVAWAQAKLKDKNG